MISQKSKSVIHSFWTPLLLLWLFFFLSIQLSSFNNLPRGVHQWAQADRYAIAARYLDERSFLDPATYSLTSDDGAVGVEFPLIQYISARIARIFGSEYLPFIYRSLTFLLVLSGCLMVSRRILGHNLWLNLLAVVIVISSPVILNYGNGFLPDAAAYGLILMAASLVSNKKNSKSVIMVLLLGTATLIKTSAGVYLIALLAWWFFKMIVKRERNWMFPFVTGLIFCVLIFLYDYYYIHLRNKELWSTLFLSQSHKLTSFADFKAMIRAFGRYSLQYLNWSQFLLLAAGGILAFRSLLKDKVYSGLIGLTLFGLLCFVYLFGIQFINHDYYIIATYAPLSVPIMLLAIKWLSKKLDVWKQAGILVLLAILSFSLGSSQYFKRMGNSVVIGNQEYGYSFEWLRGLKKDINSVTHPGDTVFVVYEMEPNLSLVYLDKRGIVFNREEMSRDTSNMYYWLERRKPNYLLCRNRNQEELYSRHAKFMEHTEVALKREEYTIYRIDHGY